MNASYIKTFRKIRDWQWYTDGATMRVFVELLLTATYKEVNVRGEILQPGELIATVSEIGRRLDLTTAQVRTALKHLESTGEITIRCTNKYSVISITNWGVYQGGSEPAAAPKVKRTTFTPPTREEVQEYIQVKGLGNVDADYFIDYYESKGWKVGNAKMKDWKATARNWSRRTFETAPATKTDKPKQKYAF